MAELTRAARSVAISFRLGACALLVVAADFLFYGHGVGWTAELFGFLLLGVTAIVNPAALHSRQGWMLFGICLALCLGLVETDNLMTLVLFGLFFAALFTGMQLGEAPLTWLRKLLAFIAQACGLAAVADARGYYSDQVRKRGPAAWLEVIGAWLLPVMVAVVFVVLFADANPVIDRWIISLDWAMIDALLAPERVVFWCVAGVMVWGALRAGHIRIAPAAPSPDEQDRRAGSPVLALLFSRGAVMRSLAIANLLFLAQNLLDANFLWAGAALPEGITYAEYAHRGAYPLILTALLAAAFVLVAMRPGGGLQQDRLIRGLIYVWLFQNLVLVASSIWRTQLYVADYSLTYLRLAALLWMGLVLVGLVLIVARIVLDRSSDWLVRANLFAALALLLAICPLDMGRFIAGYNVTHASTWRRLDLSYLKDIGPSALPALLRLQAEVEAGNRVDVPRSHLSQIIGDLTVDLANRNADWRRWTFRSWRLARELAPSPAPAP